MNHKKNVNQIYDAISNHLDILHIHRNHQKDNHHRPMVMHSLQTVSIYDPDISYTHPLSIQDANNMYCVYLTYI